MLTTLQKSKLKKCGDNEHLATDSQLEKKERTKRRNVPPCQSKFPAASSSRVLATRPHEHSSHRRGIRCCLSLSFRLSQISERGKQLHRRQASRKSRLPHSQVLPAARLASPSSSKSPSCRGALLSLEWSVNPATWLPDGGFWHRVVPCSARKFHQSHQKPTRGHGQELRTHPFKGLIPHTPTKSSPLVMQIYPVLTLLGRTRNSSTSQSVPQNSRPCR